MSLFFEEEEQSATSEIDQIKKLVERGAVCYVNHSAGKDSQAMYLMLKEIVPKSQLIVIHAVLPEVEWDGVIDHIKATIGDTPLVTCQANKTLFDMVESRGYFPSPKFRNCTSDLKRSPLEKSIRHSGHRLILNCMGMRAQESPGRSKLQTLKLNERNSKNGREWYDYLPIHSWKVEEVFAKIKAAGQEPHWAYARGSSRLSCCFCVMANKQDLTIAAKHNPAMYARYVALEKSTGQVMLMPSKKHGRLSLEQVTGIMAT
jgi:3'-phosphoadenosine 5'-phosphosulfate sulfotransferase (PAPS reductase)/FAD synthetase